MNLAVLVLAVTAPVVCLWSGKGDMLMTNVVILDQRRLLVVK